jgi:hypothetical protein
VALIDKLNEKREAYKASAPQRERERAERRRNAAAARAAAEARQVERMAEMPRFVVRQVREVTVAAEDMNDAIALANAAFKEGQDEDGTIKWRKPFGVDGDTIDKIKTLNVKATELEDYEY